MIQYIYIRDCCIKFDGYVHVAVKAFYEIPKSVSVKDKEKMLAGIIRPAKKPDIDNVIKIVLDSLNGVAYADDKQVVSVSGSKHYCCVPRIEISISEISLPRPITAANGKG